MKKRLAKQRAKQEKHKETKAAFQAVLRNPAPSGVPEVPAIPGGFQEAPRKRKLPKAPTGVEQKKPNKKDVQKQARRKDAVTAADDLDHQIASLLRDTKAHAGIQDRLDAAMAGERKDLEELERRKNREAAYFETDLAELQWGEGTQEEFMLSDEHAALVHEAENTQAKHKKVKAHIRSAEENLREEIENARSHVEFIHNEIYQLVGPHVRTQGPRLEEELQEAVNIQWKAEQELDRMRGGSGLEPMPDVLPEADIGDVFTELMRQEAMDALDVLIPSARSSATTERLDPGTPESKMDEPHETPHTPPRERTATKHTMPPKRAKAILVAPPRGRAILVDRPRGRAEVTEHAPREGARAARTLEVHGGGGASVAELYEKPRKSGTVTQTQPSGVDMQAILNTNLAEEDFPNVQNEAVIVSMTLLERLGGDKRNMSKKNVKQFKKKLEELKKNPKFRETFTGFFEKRRWERFVDQYIKPSYLILDPEARAEDEARLRRLGRYRSPTPSTYRSVHGSEGAASFGGLSDAPEFQRSQRGTYHSGRKSVQADEIPEEDAATYDSGRYHSQPSQPVRRRRASVPAQSLHNRKLRRNIHPVLRKPNFSLRKVSANTYILSATDVTHGVVDQIRGLLQRVPGKRIIVDGRIFGKGSGFREIIRVLTEKGTVRVGLS